ncbi:MAG: hypothetical protein ACI8W7_004753 [Gammaproteobacteria bacterium]|jgi:hypothetical protein
MTQTYVAATIAMTIGIARGTVTAATMMTATQAIRLAAMMAIASNEIF